MASSTNFSEHLDFVNQRNESLLSIHAFTITLARRAGAYLRKENTRWRRLHKQRSSLVKGANTVDLVTESDLEVERIIREAVREAYPNHDVSVSLLTSEAKYSIGDLNTNSFILVHWRGIV